MVKASASRAADPKFDPLFLSRNTCGLKIGIPVATLPAPDVRGSALGLVGPVSVYCDYVR